MDDSLVTEMVPSADAAPTRVGATSFVVDAAATLAVRLP
jgi:hypothetical protein